MTQPTLHVTNWSSKKLHGSGRKLTIMARPRSWECGDGAIKMLAPNDSDLRAVQSGRMEPKRYFERFGEAIKEHERLGLLEPGTMLFSAGERTGPSAEWILVADGDTLCCACSREKASLGECHRVLAAGALLRSGWRVLLDGRVLIGIDDSGRPIVEAA